ncbi:MAG: protein translocase subunit SecD [Candidatus Schekmanbacteria bacterium]|nr:protein translocase subunit SecD [Candidatus Schekmanbacteria bacterium]
MTSRLWTNIAIVIFVLAFSFYKAWPPYDHVDESGAKVKGKINLGLDLQGGMHLVLTVHTEEAVQSEVDIMRRSLQSRLEDAGVYKAQLKSTGTTIEATVEQAAHLDKLRQVVEEDFPVFSEAGTVGDAGVGLSFVLDSRRDRQIREEAVNQALETIRRRVDELGVSEPIIQRQGLAGQRLIVQLPGVEDPKRALDVIKKTARLEFRLVVDEGPEEAVLRQKYRDKLERDLELFPQSLDKKEAPDTPPHAYYVVQRESPITGADLETARMGSDEIGLPAVDFMLMADGGRRIREFSAKHVGDRLAIVLDGKVHSAPVIRSALGSRSQITGSFTTEEAQDLSLVLRAGALPASLSVLEQRSVGPSLGQDSIRQGVFSVAAGGALVVLLMMVLYKASGLVANVALAANLLIIAGALAGLSATLTLPGIAGIILTVGMAVDSNILIFERIKEELRLGKTVRTAIQAGFSRTFWTIMDANVTTLIAGLVLLQFGTGPVRGFAVTLCIGILSTLFAAIVVSRLIYDLILVKWRLQRLSI